MSFYKPIKNDDDYQIVNARIKELDKPIISEDEADEKEVLIALVEYYERKKKYENLDDPIDVLKKIMKDRKLKQKDLLPYIGSLSKVSEVLSYRRPLSISMVRKLHEGLGIPAEILIKDVSQSHKKAIDKLDIYPFTEMYNKGWFNDIYKGNLLDAKKHKKEILSSFIAEFGVIDPIIHANYDNYDGTDIELGSILAWRVKAIRNVKDEKLPKWDKSALSHSFFYQLARLTYFSEGPKLIKQYLNMFGIHVSIESNLKNTRFDSAVMLMPDGSPLIALTLKHDRLDYFYMILFHALSHLKLHVHDENTIFIDNHKLKEDTTEEKEANKSVLDVVINTEAWKASGLNLKSTAKQIREFSNHEKISPSLTAAIIRYINKDSSSFYSLATHGKLKEAFNYVVR